LNSIKLEQSELMWKNYLSRGNEEFIHLIKNIIYKKI